MNKPRDNKGRFISGGAISKPQKQQLLSTLGTRAKAISESALDPATQAYLEHLKETQFSRFYQGVKLGKQFGYASGRRAGFVGGIRARVPPRATGSSAQATAQPPSEPLTLDDVMRQRAARLGRRRVRYI